MISTNLFQQYPSRQSIILENDQKSTVSKPCDDGDDDDALTIAVSAKRFKHTSSKLESAPAVDCEPTSSLSNNDTILIKLSLESELSFSILFTRAFHPYL